MTQNKVQMVPNTVFVNDALIFVNNRVRHKSI